MMLGKTTAALLLGLGCGYAAATPAEAAPKCVLDPNAEYTGGSSEQTSSRPALRGAHS